MRRALCLVLALPACSIVIGKAETCGRVPEKGGPGVIVTLDDEVCDIVRIRLSRVLDQEKELSRGHIDELLDKSLTWERKDTVDGFLSAVGKDAGDPVADDLRRGIDSVLAQSKRTPGADCGGPQECLVRGAAKGARIALRDARPTETVLPASSTKKRPDPWE